MRAYRDRQAIASVPGYAINAVIVIVQVDAVVEVNGQSFPGARVDDIGYRAAVSDEQPTCGRFIPGVLPCRPGLRYSDRSTAPQAAPIPSPWACTQSTDTGTAPASCRMT